ncbi:MAG: pyrroline-5-carboxylate reductase [Candidatus Marinimicrobia bacterium]|nr:pyrroline-5-carboxylate reductase [Candidatus Neomarinimicrobiota bacterium]
MKNNITIIGCGNIGNAIAQGLVKSKKFASKNIILTRRSIKHLHEFQEQGFTVSADNCTAVSRSEIVILAVTPSQIVPVLKEINSLLSKNHLVISVVSGVFINDMKKYLSKEVRIVRAMPNTAAALCESITCLASESQNDSKLVEAENLFNAIGQTLKIEESQMASATALGACGIAFFLRAIRAASQGGIEIGFHSDEAFAIAAQTARGAATLLLNHDSHPEAEIDKVTTPQGATIAGLNEMEHQGFSSAMIKGITTSTGKIDKLFDKTK